jgi:hypothetical protein
MARIPQGAGVKRALVIAEWVLIVLVLSAAALYGADWLVFRVRLAHSPSSAIGTIQVEPEYAVPEKSGRAEVYFGDTETDKCVHAIFPHAGYPPCWYLARKNKAIVM